MQKSNVAWEEVARDFARMVEIDAHRKFILLPAIYRMLEHSYQDPEGIRGKLIFDAGCGDGGVARYISEKGGQVLAVDFSDNMIDEAKRKTNANSQIKYEKIDLTKPLPYSSGLFDLIICSMVLMDIPYIKRPLRELARILKVGGEIIIAISHPSYTVPFVKISRNLQDKILGKEAKIKFIEYPIFKRVEKKIAGLRATTPYFQRRVSFYLNAISQAGFKICEAKEPLLSKRYKKLLPHLIHATKIPMFLILRAQKLDS
ncbi:MAG: methyltransferase domain-containing protein [Candidatus Berkelbacteria bacterium]|nr:methyltransferase domain-containing protein [Candidatus Berkelbacteria bacterium]